jgi:hypothetical protein
MTPPRIGAPVMDHVRLHPILRGLMDYEIESMIRSGEVMFQGGNLIPRASGGTLANDGIIVAPDGSGANVATHLLNSKEYQAFVQADSEGHIMGTIPTYMLYQEPRVTGASAADLWDLFVGASATHSVRLLGLWPLVTHSAASAFTTPWRFDVIRTTAIGTGGAAASVDAAAPATGIVSINKTDTSDAALATLDANITVRGLPTGGATAGTLLFPVSIFFEEGSTANAMAEVIQQYLNIFPQTGADEYLRLRPGFGIKVRQVTAAASTGALIGWLMQFSVI